MHGQDLHGGVYSHLNVVGSGVRTCLSLRGNPLSGTAPSQVQPAILRQAGRRTTHTTTWAVLDPAQTLQHQYEPHTPPPGLFWNPYRHFNLNTNHTHHHLGCSGPRTDTSTSIRTTLTSTRAVPEPTQTLRPQYEPHTPPPGLFWTPHRHLGLNTKIQMSPACTLRVTER